MQWQLSGDKVNPLKNWTNVIHKKQRNLYMTARRNAGGFALKIKTDVLLYFDAGGCKIYLSYMLKGENEQTQRTHNKRNNQYQL